MKRHILILLLMTVLGCLSLRAVNTIIYNATYDYSNLTLGTDTLGGVTYTTVSYDGLYNEGDPGMPSLPVDYIRFSVPWNATNFSVSASLQNNLISNINHLVYPCQRPRLMNDTTPVTITLPDSSAYYSNTYYPTQNAFVVDEGFLAGENHIVTVAVMPISYYYRKKGGIITNKLRESQTVRLTLSYELRDSLEMYPIVRQDSTLRSEGYELTRRIVVNPTNVQAYAPINLIVDSLNIMIPNSGDGLNGGVDPGIPIPNDSASYHGGEQSIDGYPYLIVTTPELLYAVRRIAALKRQKGYNVKVVTMQDVLSNPYTGQGDVINNVLTFTDDAGKLRQYLRTCFRNLGIKYVLLAGNGVPYRKKTFYLTEAPSDLYYSDLSADWYAGKTEKYPELFVGRILAKNQEQIENYTDKLYRYELNPGHGNPSYLKRALYTEGIEMSGYSNSIRLAFGNVFPVDTVIQESEWNKYPRGADIINAINDTQYGYLGFLNHSDPSSIAVYGLNKSRKPNVYDNRIYWIWAHNSCHVNSSAYYYCDTIGNALNLISNKWMPNILYNIGCTSMPYDTIPGYESIPMSFGESFTTGKDYGGPAYLGNTRDGMLGRSDVLEALFAQQVVGGNYKLGPAESMSKVFLKKDYNSYPDTINENQLVDDNLYFSCVHNLLGDPEFEIWTDIPQGYDNIELVRNDTSITVSGFDVGSSIVAYSDNNGFCQQKIATTDSVTFNRVSPNGTIMLYKHNCLPYIAPLILQHVNLSKSQYLIATDVDAGQSVDSVRTCGEVTVKNGVEYEIEASGTVTLHDGFKVEKGATFAVYPSSF